LDVLETKVDILDGKAESIENKLSRAVVDRAKRTALPGKEPGGKAKAKAKKKPPARAAKKPTVKVRRK
jgi:hypothetical protein